MSFVRKQLQLAGVRGIPLFDLCTNCNILRITDRATGSVEYHGLVEVRPARIALQAIQILNGQEFGGRAIAVRRYRHRTIWGESRHRSDPATAASWWHDRCLSGGESISSWSWSRRLPERADEGEAPILGFWRRLGTGGVRTAPVSGSWRTLATAAQSVPRSVSSMT